MEIVKSLCCAKSGKRRKKKKKKKKKILKKKKTKSIGFAISVPHPFRVELSNSKRNCPITYPSTTVTYFLAINSTRDHGHDDGQTDCRADTHDRRSHFSFSRTKRTHRCVNSVALGRRIKGSNRRLNRCSGSTLPTRTAYTFTRHLAVAVASLFIRNSGLAGSRSENLGWPYLPERNGHWVLGEDADVESYFRPFY